MGNKPFIRTKQLTKTHVEWPVQVAWPLEFLASNIVHFLPRLELFVLVIVNAQCNLAYLLQHEEDEEEEEEEVRQAMMQFNSKTNFLFRPHLRPQIPVQLRILILQNLPFMIKYKTQNRQEQIRKNILLFLENSINTWSRLCSALFSVSRDLFLIPSRDSFSSFCPKSFFSVLLSDVSFRKHVSILLDKY